MHIANVSLAGRYEVKAIPQMIFDHRQALFGEDPVEGIPMEQISHLDSFREKAKAGASLRVAFLGASYVGGALWSYKLMDGLKQAYTKSDFHSAIIAYGGEGTMHGVQRFEKEVLV